jgi:hypothetical protein
MLLNALLCSNSMAVVVQIAWAMASRLIVGYFLDHLESVEIDNDCSSCYNHVGGIKPSVLSMSFHSSSTLSIGDKASNYCQCSDDEALVECLTCGSWFDINTYCPGC